MSKSALHHVAISVQNFEWYVDFFEKVFEMTVRKTAGEAPKRQLWFHQGIQVNEVTAETQTGETIDHISLAVEDIPATVQEAISMGCQPCAKGVHWFVMPNGVKMELMQL